MKAPELFQLYNWFIDTIYRSGGISLKELNQRWIRTEVSAGIPMTRTTFNRYKDSIEEMFGINIECRRKGGYQYYIEKDALKSNNLQKQKSRNQKKKIIPEKRKKVKQIQKIPEVMNNGFYR